VRNFPGSALRGFGYKRNLPANCDIAPTLGAAYICRKGL